jgi:acetyl esterase/lipase
LKTNPNVILWLHGGGYLTGPGQAHFDLLAKICNLSGSTGILVKYPKAPEATYETTLAQLLVLYRRLLEDFKDEPITVMGDSAGGGLGLAFTLYLKELQIKLPNKLFLFSPWVDISMQNPAILDLDHKDVLLGIEGLKAQGKMYAGENADLSDYKLSPINGNFKGLPPIFLTVSAQELFLPDCRKLRALAVQAGVDVTYIEHPNLFHDWVLFPMPEATAMIETIADQLQNTQTK